jgi:hypothetical protein
VSTYYLGQPYRESLTVKDVTGALVDPTTVTLTYRYPDGTTQLGPAAIRDSLGQYHADVSLPDAGRYRRLWATTGPGAGVDVEDVYVVDPLAPEIVGLDDVKRHLNIDLGNVSFDPELTDFIAALPPVVEQLAGPVLPVEVTEDLYSSWAAARPAAMGLRTSVLVVTRPPIASVSSVLAFGGSVSIATNDFVVDKAAGLISYATGIHPGLVTVTYVSGYADVPGAINLAARIIVEHWWTSQRAKAASGRADRVDSGDLIDVPGMGFAIPRYAAELLQPFNPGTGLH